MRFWNWCISLSCSLYVSAAVSMHSCGLKKKRDHCKCNFIFARSSYNLMEIRHLNISHSKVSAMLCLSLRQIYIATREIVLSLTILSITNRIINPPFKLKSFRICVFANLTSWCVCVRAKPVLWQYCCGWQVLLSLFFNKMMPQNSGYTIKNRSNSCYNFVIG